MRLTSFRTRILVLATVFSVAMVATVLVTTYVVVHDGMLATARTETVRMAGLAAREVADTRARVKDDVASRGLSGRAANEEAMAAFVGALPSTFGITSFGEGHIAVWDSTGKLRYRSDELAVVKAEFPEPDAMRAIRADVPNAKLLAAFSGGERQNGRTWKHGCIVEYRR